MHLKMSKRSLIWMNVGMRREITIPIPMVKKHACSKPMRFCNLSSTRSYMQTMRVKIEMLTK